MVRRGDLKRFRRTTPNQALPCSRARTGQSALQFTPANLQESVAKSSKAGGQIFELFGRVRQVGGGARIRSELAEKVVPSVTCGSPKPQRGCSSIVGTKERDLVVSLSKFGPKLDPANVRHVAPGRALGAGQHRHLRPDELQHLLAGEREVCVCFHSLVAQPFRVL